MTTIYVKTGEGNKDVLAICNEPVGDIIQPAVTSEPVEFNKLGGYWLNLGMGDVYILSYSEDLYKEKKAKQEALIQEAVANATKMQIIEREILPLATDEEAYAISFLYNSWEVGKDYKAGDRFRYGGKFYKVTVDHTAKDIFPPDMEGVNIYVEIPEPADKFPQYKRPTGAHDAYNAGDGMTFTDGKKYVCAIDGTVHSPEEYPAAWMEVTDDVPEGYDLGDEPYEEPVDDAS